MLIVLAFVDALLASVTLFEFTGLITLLLEMLVVCLYLYDLATVLALSKHHAVLPEMHVEVFVNSEALI
jgi:hypothetical protein